MSESNPAAQPLPANVTLCHEMIRQQNESIRQLQSANQQLQSLLDHQQALIAQQLCTNEDLSAELAKVHCEIEDLKRYIYGRRSERHVKDSQLSLFDSEDAESQSEAANDAAPLPQLELEQITYARRKRQRADRFGDHLPRIVKTIDVPEQERVCECCGSEMPIIETDVRQKLEYVPAKLVVYELHYPKRACGKCQGGVKVAPPPPPSEPEASFMQGGSYGYGVVTQIIASKFADHLPLYRLEDIFARAGVTIPRSTMIDQLTAASDKLQPLRSLMHQRQLQSGVLGLDETPVDLQDPELPGRMRQARMWLSRGSPAAPYNVFFFHENRKQEGALKFLDGYRGYAVVDAYGVHDGIYLGDDRITAVCCHAHVRRKFDKAKSSDPKRADYALAIYRQLFDIEDEAAEMDAAGRQLLRQHKSKPLLDRFKAWLDEQLSDKSVLPKLPIGEAVRYAINQWRELTVFLGDGRLPIHNNDTERDLRRLTIGRNNWLFFGSEAGGETAAILYSVVASACRHNLDVWAYINDVLRTLAGGNANLELLLPDRWAADHPEAIRTYRQQESLARASKTKARRALARRLGKH